MSECSEHRGKYLHEAACLKCLSLYWEMQYKAQRTKVAELEAFRDDVMAYCNDGGETMDEIRYIHAKHFLKEQSGHE